jgi:hypothetical protein
MCTTYLSLSIIAKKFNIHYNFFSLCRGGGGEGGSAG